MFVEQCITILLQQLYKIVIAVFLSKGIILAVIACGIRLQNHIFCVQNMFFCGITDISHVLLFNVGVMPLILFLPYFILWYFFTCDTKKKIKKRKKQYD